MHAGSLSRLPSQIVRQRIPALHRLLARSRLLAALLVLSLGCVLLAFCYHGYGYPGYAHTTSTCCSGRPAPRDATDHPDRIRYKHTHRHLPQCLIIGARKCGTRALIEFLNLHSAVRIHRSEVHFFDDDDAYRHGLEWYRRQMPFSYPDQITVEKTPAYFTSPEVPARVRAMNSSSKLLLVVRDPIERTISDFLQVNENKRLQGKPLLGFQDRILDSQGRVNLSYRAVWRSIYHRHLENWLHYFPAQQILILDAANLVQQPWVELEKVEKFLDLRHELTREKFYFNTTKGFYCLRRENSPGCLASSKGRHHPTIDRFVLKILQEFFRPLNQKFYQLAGRDFGW